MSLSWVGLCGAGLPQEAVNVLQEAQLWRYAATLTANTLTGSDRAITLERWAAHIHQVCCRFVTTLVPGMSFSLVLAFHFDMDMVTVKHCCAVAMLCSGDIGSDTITVPRPETLLRPLYLKRNFVPCHTGGTSA